MPTCCKELGFYDKRRKTILNLHIKACLCYTELLMVLQKIHLIKRVADDGLSMPNCSFTRSAGDENP